MLASSPGSSRTSESLYERQGVRAPGKFSPVSGLHCYLKQMHEHSKQWCFFFFKSLTSREEREKRKEKERLEINVPTIQAVDTDDQMDALVAALVFLQAEVGHGGRQLGHLAVHETRQLQLFHFFLRLYETAQQSEKQFVKADSRGKTIERPREVTHAFICVVGVHSNHRRPKDGGLEGQGGLAEPCPGPPEARPEQMGALDESLVSWR